MHAWLTKKLKISHHKHSGRLRPHEYTSYMPLAVLLIFVGFLLCVCTANAAHPGPQAGSIGVSGTMPGKPPTIAATITSPSNGQHFSTSPITIAGTCPANTLVEIYKNNIFAGSDTCGTSGKYSFQVDLLIGRNDLVARVYDDLNQPGPDSNTVTVFYDAVPPQAAPLASLGLTSSQLLLNTDAVYRGVFPDQALSMPITILGGTPPYALNIQWDDNTNKVVSRNDNLTFNVDHTYHKAGTYEVTLQASDSQGRVAFLTVAVIVNGQPPITPVASTTKVAMNKLLVLWPLYAAAIAMLISFWLGERREKHILENAPLRPHLQA